VDKVICIQTHDFNQQTEYERLKKQSSIGAVVTFTGLVRDVNQHQSVVELSLEHYPGMTEKSLEKIIQQAKERWNIIASTVIHRVGTFSVSDQIVFVGVACPHRGDAFSACEFIMDYLKTDAPFWKKETLKNGETKWVDARESDQQALSKWDIS